MADLLEHQHLNLVTPDSNIDSSWMFMFVFVMSRCCRLITCPALSDNEAQAQYYSNSNKKKRKEKNSMGTLYSIK